MIPTRLQIQMRISEAIDDQKPVQEEIVNWLNEIECPDKDREMIMSDLESYVIHTP